MMGIDLPPVRPSDDHNEQDMHAPAHGGFHAITAHVESPRAVVFENSRDSASVSMFDRVIHGAPSPVVRADIARALSYKYSAAAARRSHLRTSVVVSSSSSDDDDDGNIDESASSDIGSDAIKSLGGLVAGSGPTDARVLRLRDRLKPRSGLGLTDPAGIDDFFSPPPGQSVKVATTNSDVMATASPLRPRSSLDVYIAHPDIPDEALSDAALPDAASTQTPLQTRTSLLPFPTSLSPPMLPTQENKPLPPTPSATIEQRSSGPTPSATIEQRSSGPTPSATIEQRSSGPQASLPPPPRPLVRQKALDESAMNDALAALDMAALDMAALDMEALDMAAAESSSSLPALPLETTLVNDAPAARVDDSNTGGDADTTCDMFSAAEEVSTAAETGQIDVEGTLDHPTRVFEPRIDGVGVSGSVADSGADKGEKEPVEEPTVVLESDSEAQTGPPVVNVFSGAGLAEASADFGSDDGHDSDEVPEPSLLAPEPASQDLHRPMFFSSPTVPTLLETAFEDDGDDIYITSSPIPQTAENILNVEAPSFTTSLSSDDDHAMSHFHDGNLIGHSFTHTKSTPPQREQSFVPSSRSSVASNSSSSSATSSLPLPTRVHTSTSSKWQKKVDEGTGRGSWKPVEVTHVPTPENRKAYRKQSGRFDEALLRDAFKVSSRIQPFSVTKASGADRVVVTPLTKLRGVLNKAKIEMPTDAEEEIAAREVAPMPAAHPSSASRVVVNEFLPSPEITDFTETSETCPTTFVSEPMPMTTAATPRAAPAIAALKMSPLQVVSPPPVALLRSEDVSFDSLPPTRLMDDEDDGDTSLQPSVDLLSIAGAVENETAPADLLPAEEEESVSYAAIRSSLSPIEEHEDEREAEVPEAVPGTPESSFIASFYGASPDRDWLSLRRSEFSRGDLTPQHILKTFTRVTPHTGDFPVPPAHPEPQQAPTVLETDPTNPFLVVSPSPPSQEQQQQPPSSSSSNNSHSATTTLVDSRHRVEAVLETATMASFANPTSGFRSIVSSISRIEVDEDPAGEVVVVEEVEVPVASSSLVECGDIEWDESGILLAGGDGDAADDGVAMDEDEDADLGMEFEEVVVDSVGGGAGGERSSGGFGWSGFGSGAGGGGDASFRRSAAPVSGGGGGDGDDDDSRKRRGSFGTRPIEDAVADLSRQIEESEVLEAAAAAAQGHPDAVIDAYVDMRRLIAQLKREVAAGEGECARMESEAKVRDKDIKERMVATAERIKNAELELKRMQESVEATTMRIAEYKKFKVESGESERSNVVVAPKPAFDWKKSFVSFLWYSVPCFLAITFVLWCFMTVAYSRDIIFVRMFGPVVPSRTVHMHSSAPYENDVYSDSHPELKRVKILGGLATGGSWFEHLWEGSLEACDFVWRAFVLGFRQGQRPPVPV